MNAKITQEPENPIAAEVIAQAVVDIAAAAKKLASSRLNRRAIVTLIHEQSKVSRKNIELVLNNLESFEHLWLKPIKPKQA